MAKKYKKKTLLSSFLSILIVFFIVGLVFSLLNSNSMPSDSTIDSTKEPLKYVFLEEFLIF